MPIGYLLKVCDLTRILPTNIIPIYLAIEIYSALVGFLAKPNDSPRKILASSCKSVFVDDFTRFWISSEPVTVSSGPLCNQTWIEGGKILPKKKIRKSLTESLRPNRQNSSSLIYRKTIRGILKCRVKNRLSELFYLKFQFSRTGYTDAYELSASRVLLKTKKVSRVTSFGSCPSWRPFRYRFLVCYLRPFQAF